MRAIHSQIKFFIMFFNLLICSPANKFWDIVEETGSTIQCLITAVFYYFNFNVESSFMKRLSLDKEPQEV